MKFIFKLSIIISSVVILLTSSVMAKPKTFKCSIMGISADRKPINFELKEGEPKKEIALQNPVQFYAIDISASPLLNSDKTHIVDATLISLTTKGIHYNISRKVKPEDKLAFDYEGVASGSFPIGGYVWVFGLAEIACNNK